jgi:glucose-6-phosphate isomerase
MIIANGHDQLARDFDQVKNQLVNNQPYLFDANIDFAEISSFAAKIKNRYKRVVIVGFGASSLNLRALLSCLNGFSCEFFYVDNMDHNLFALAKMEDEATAIFAISQSGETQEVIWILQNIKITCSNLYVVTKRGSTLFNLTKSLNAHYLEYGASYNVGRCSVFCPIFFKLAEIAGADARKLFDSGVKALDDVDIKNQVIEESSWLLNQYNDSKRNLVMLSYVPQLTGFLEWLKQIFAESLGKNGFGLMPYGASGTCYEHSILQLFLDGPNDKIYKMFFKLNAENSFEALLQNHGQKVLESLDQLGRSVKSYSFKQVTEELIGTLIIKYIYIIALVAKNIGFEPFNQPAVEKLKSLSRLVDRK